MEPLAWYRIVLPAAVCIGLLVFAAVRPIARFRFAAMGLISLVGYGVIKDQFTARLCPEYFTGFHPPIPGLTDPTLLGLAWGFLGAWWGGVLLGYSAGLTATLGPRPSLAPRELVRPLAVLLAAVAAVAALTGFNVARHAELLGVTVGPDVAGLLPPERHRPLLVVACTHFAAYATAIVGGVLVCVWLAAERKRRANLTPELPPCPTPPPS